MWLFAAVDVTIGSYAAGSRPRRSRNAARCCLAGASVPMPNVHGSPTSRAATVVSRYGAVVTPSMM